MNEHFFGLHWEHLRVAADRIAKRHGAWHVNYTDPDGRRRGWFGCPNRGEPFDSERAGRVMADIDRVGGLQSLLYARDREEGPGPGWD